jgi:hypothetical protein
LHELSIGVGQRDASAVAAGHVGEMIQGEPIVPRQRGRIMAAIGEQFGANDRPGFFVPDIRRSQVETKAPRVRFGKVLIDLVGDVDAVRCPKQR